MTVRCPNPCWEIEIAADESRAGETVGCPACGHQFVLPPCCGDFVAYDLLISRLGIRDDGIRRHDARGDVELLGHAVSRMWQHLRLPPDAAGFRRHETSLPVH